MCLQHLPRKSFGAVWCEAEGGGELAEGDLPASHAGTSPDGAAGVRGCRVRMQREHQPWGRGVAGEAVAEAARAKGASRDS